MNKSKAKIGVKPQSPASSSSAPPGRGTPPQRGRQDGAAAANAAAAAVPFEGIYQNLRFCETVTSLMGNTVQVR